MAPTCFSFSSSPLSATTLETYQHAPDGTLTYRTNKPSKNGLPLVLIHPVGIGLNSWYWSRVLERWQDSPVYAPDLAGCGTRNGGTAWHPNERPLSLTWAQGVESLLQCLELHNVTVVTQGGLAPVGVLLAARNPDRVSKLVLASPPTYQDMMTPIPQKELQRNFAFLTSPVTAPLAFGLLEQAWAIRFFSNTFLFAKDCDEEWVQLARQTATPDQRWAVAAFNAGFCNQQSFQHELTTLIQQPTLILSGEDDRRDRQDYVTYMPNCRWLRLPGCNVLPWENSEDFCQSLYNFHHPRTM
jgi:pimeloyl-ACP methyl ester carboxylesterase